MNRTLAKRLTLVLTAALALIVSTPREDHWRVIGPGGGGALFHPTVNPHDPRTALVSCDMTGNYIATDAGGRWHSFNLGGPVQFFLFDPIDPLVIYATAGALFRSADGDTTWARFFPSTVAKTTMGDDHASHTLHVTGGPRGDIGAMAIDPEDSRALYLVLDLALWTCADGGATWQKSADLPGPARRLWIDPRSSRADRTLYVAGPDAMYRRQAGGWRSPASGRVLAHSVTGRSPARSRSGTGDAAKERELEAPRRTPMLGGFIVGAIAGGVVVWKYRDSLRDYVKDNAGPTRERVDGLLRTVQQRSETLLDQAKEQLSSRLERTRDKVRARASAAGRGRPTE